MESSRILEESRKQVEEEVGKKSFREMRGGPEEPPSQLSSPAAALEPRTSESLNPSHVKRCPKCNTIYKSELLAYCSYDATLLINADDPSFNSPAAHPLERQTLWVLVAITLVGSAFITYLLNNYLFKEKSSASAPIAMQTEEQANAKKDLPTIGGALIGTEINLPSPEYPANVKSEGTSGTVTVVVRVNRKGIVISERALNGNPLLQAAALEAAKRATFSPEKLAGHGGVVSATITYTFKL
jgi:TonB family protein